ncbi:MAG: acyltransferase domain-containing protein [Betaproteobacteria bacterium]|nr:acyltransferase domain-containing protein [Betaproteobacteria bacterium]
MSEFLNRIGNFSAKRLALLADELNDRVQALEESRHAPIAIVGMGCRLPGGADTPEKYWQLLREGVDAVEEVPASRWDIDALFDPDPDAPGRMSTRWGGFVGPVDGFDPHFFGISPREAASMDPQQRLVLEVAWRALEHAGISPHGLQGTRTGVFLGLSAADYYQILRAGGIRAFDAYTASGTAHSIASGRLSYVLGLNGPSLSIDTACSSSLVAIHQAVHSLRRGECNLALAGGVNLILGPDITIALSKSHMMAPDGRCKAFDARADGFVRGEGCGLLVLKRAADARADGDRIFALIRGSAANQDGRSNGLTAPSGPAQEAVIRDALADARCAPQAIGFVEAHGTGTSLGDPIEVQALQAVLGAPRAKGSAKLRVGSVKASIGHLEAAAGVASVIKVAMALQHREIPGQLHLQVPNPHIPWERIAVEVPRTLTAWEAPAEGPRLAGVSSFGFSGTNVHLVLEEAPAPADDPSAAGRDEGAVHVLPFSARNEAALRTLLAEQAEAIACSSAHLADIAHTLGAGRAHFGHRVAAIAGSRAEAAALIATGLRDEPQPRVHCGVAPTRTPRIGFLFTGQGSQYAGMSQGLYRSEPVFRAALDRCDELLRAHHPQSLLSVLFPAPGEPTPIDETAWTQPALFSVEYALAQLWLSWGVRPAMVMGHSVGEYVAACVAGIFGLEDALALIAARGRLMGALPAGGAMAAVRAGEERVAALLREAGGDGGIAAVNGPQNTVVSGSEAAVAAVAARCESEGIEVTRLKVSHAFHSALMDPMLDEFARVAGAIAHRPPGIDLVSNVTGEILAAGEANAGYWRKHVRAPVQFARAVRTLAAGGCDVFLEIGPHPTLLGMARECIESEPFAWVPSLRRSRDDAVQIRESLAALYVRGVGIDWSGVGAGGTRGRVPLPGYPFQRERYWAAIEEGVPTADERADALPAPVRRMLHEVAWRTAPPAMGGLAQARPVADAALARVDEFASDNRLDAYAGFMEGLDALAAAYVVRALAELGLALVPGDRLETEPLRRRLGVGERHRRLFERLLAILGEDGVLEAREGAWHVVAAPARIDPEARHLELLAAHPDCDAELGLTHRCAAGLAGVMRGTVDPLTLLFPEGSLAETERLYQNSPPARTYNALIATALGALLAAWPGGRRLRVLEIGAGTGSTTAYLLPHLKSLPAGSVDYCFTDVSPLFLQRAREKFPGVSFLRTQLLDIGADLGAQGFEPASFDIVIGANVLHATPDLAVTLSTYATCSLPADAWCCSREPRRSASGTSRSA